VLAKQNKYVTEQLMEMAQLVLKYKKEAATPQPKATKKEQQLSGADILQMSKAKKKAHQK
jgi:hypothetical protein